MKRYALLSVAIFAITVVSFFAASPSCAAQRGYTGPGGPALATVALAKEMRDDTYVTLRGTIIQHIGKDKYLFKDNTGTITIEIDHDKWGGQTIGPEDTVEIYGEVDKEWISVEIDVDRVVKK